MLTVFRPARLLSFRSKCGLHETFSSIFFISSEWCGCFRCRADEPAGVRANRIRHRSGSFFRVACEVAGHGHHQSWSADFAAHADTAHDGGITRAQIAHTISTTDSEDARKYLPSLLVRTRYIDAQYRTPNNADVNSGASASIHRFPVRALPGQQGRHGAFGIENPNTYKYRNFHPYPQRSYMAELKFGL